MGETVRICRFRLGSGLSVREALGLGCQWVGQLVRKWVGPVPGLLPDLTRLSL